MENGDLFLLLKLAQAIQQKIKTETNEEAKISLGKDLIIIKDEIGKRVLNLPNNSPIFPPFDSSIFIDDKSIDTNGIELLSSNYQEYQQSHQSSIIGSPSHSNKVSNIQMLSEIIDENSQKSNNYLDDNQSIEENSIYSFPGQQNSLIDYSTDDIATKFSKFLQQKELNKVSRNQKPKSKIPVPKQK